MKTPVSWVLQQCERKTMGKFTIGLLAAVFFGLTVLVACNDKDTDEQQSSASKAVAGQQTAAQKPGEKPDADEGEEAEEGPATPAAVAAEKPAPQQPPGKQSVYNFDNDTPGQLPAKFHGAKFRRLYEETNQDCWPVSIDARSCHLDRVPGRTGCAR